MHRTWLGNRSRSEAQKALASTLDASWLELVARGVKGHPSLYLIAPLPDVGNAACVPNLPNDSGTQASANAYRAEADAYRIEEECVPFSPSGGGTTKNYPNNFTHGQHAACASGDAPPAVRKGDRCPVCHGGTILTVDEFMRNRGMSPKPELRGELRCPNCCTAWCRDGTFKRFSEQHVYAFRQSV